MRNMVALSQSQVAQYSQKRRVFLIVFYKFLADGSRLIKFKLVAVLLPPIKILVL